MGNWDDIETKQRRYPDHSLEVLTVCANLMFLKFSTDSNYKLISFQIASIPFIIYLVCRLIQKVKTLVGVMVLNNNNQENSSNQKSEFQCIMKICSYLCLIYGVLNFSKYMEEVFGNLMFAKDATGEIFTTEDLPRMIKFVLPIDLYLFYRCYYNHCKRLEIIAASFDGGASSGSFFMQSSATLISIIS